MALEDEMKEGSISSLIIESLESNQNGDALSPEDLAWVDSCLIKDPEISDSNWNALKDALLEIVSSKPEALSYSATGSGVSPREIEIEIEMSSKDAETAEFPGTIDVDVVPVHIESEANNDSYPIKQNNGMSLSEIFQGDDVIETFVGDPFLPSYQEGKKVYKDGERVSKDIGSGLDLGPLAVEMEPLSEDIFKVWDLGVSAEEDELVKLLNKALEGNSFQSTLSAFDDSETWRNLKEESLDNLIAGIADLSLDKKSR